MKSNQTLNDALGLQRHATDAEVQRTARRLLMLLHPDFGINAVIKGTKQQQRIEAAFKKLSALRI